MAAFRLRKSQPASLACYLLQKLRINWNHPLVFHDDFDPPSALPRSACRVFLREVLDPAITQYLTVSRRGAGRRARAAAARAADGGWGGQQGPYPYLPRHPHPPTTCPATYRAAPRAAQPVTVVVGAGLGCSAMSSRTS